MSTLSRFFSIPVGIFLGASLAACGKPGTVQGKISDNNGAQARALGGQGTVAAATTATLSIVGDDGSLTVIGEADVQADGSYSIESETVGEGKLVIQALDEGGQVLGSVILDQALAAGETTIAAPITTETSVEAEVFVQMATDAALDVDDIDTCDLKARIDTLTALAVNASADAEGDIAALAQATASAQAAFFASLNTTAQESFNASLQAAIDLAAELDAQADSVVQSEEAYDGYISALFDAYVREGFDEDACSDAQITASVAFQLTVNAQASAEVATQAALQAQAYQAATISVASEALLEAAGAADASIQAVVAAGTQLRSDLSAAQDLAAGANAYATFEASVVSGNNAALEIASGADLDVALALQQATIDTAFATFDAALALVATVDAETTARGVVDAYAAMDATVSAAVSGALIASGQATADACASIFVSAEASALVN